MQTQKEHWEKIYAQKSFQETSWYQEMPSTSIGFLQSAQLPKSAKIIDIGGGESRLVNYLLAEGFEDITVLDISQNALEKKRSELGAASEGKVTWIVSDVVEFQPSERYDFWHDRATFHFLTQEEDIEKYLQTIRHFIAPNGTLVIGTFAENGPTQCSGLAVKRYSENSLSVRLSNFFQKIRCIVTDHPTPFKTIQQFVFCSFRQSVLPV